MIILKKMELSQINFITSNDANKFYVSLYGPNQAHNIIH